MKLRLICLALTALVSTSGCIAKTAFDVATAPVRIASRAVDLATTSQSEADEARGREIRQREEEIARLDREYDELVIDCRDGLDRACREAVILRQEIERQLLTVPLEPVDD